MKRICKDILEKHLDGRKLDMTKIKNWAEMIINDIEDSFKKKYSDFFLIYFFIYLIKLLLEVIMNQFIIPILIKYFSWHLIQMIFIQK